ncbi:MAG: radical SAM protein [bacterium]|nr:radical SAM protein [bacterium]
MSGSITYRAGRSGVLYVNVIEKYDCQNKCIFCGRPHDRKEAHFDNIYEHGFSLYNSKSPSTEDVVDSIEKNIHSDDKYISFVGLGEPLLYLPKIIKITKTIKEEFNIKVNVNTNGLIGAVYPNAVKELEIAGLDRISISLNASDKDEYNKLCKPNVQNAYQHLLQFIEMCRKSKIETIISFILEYESETAKTQAKESYLKFAEQLGFTEDDIHWRYYCPID